MTLSDVQTGDPHVAAHNAERHAFNAHVADTSNPHAVTKAQVGLPLADNTSDDNKPVSAAQQAAIDSAINALKAGAPAAFDTLNELATQFTNDENAAAALTTLVGAMRTLTDASFNTALAGAYYGKAAPSYAGARTRPYDSLTSMYGSSIARAAIRRALGFGLGSAKTSLVNVLIAGDSFSSGWKANTIGVDDWATVLIGLFKEAGYPVTGSWVFPGNGNTPSDGRYTYTGTWQGRTSTINNYIYSTASGNVVTLTSTVTGTIAEFSAVTATAGQTVNYSIDGGASTPFALTANQVNTKTVTGLTSGTHTITVTTTGTATVWFCGARVRDAAGLSISNAAIFGSHTEDWLPTAISSSVINPVSLPSAILGTPKLVLLGLGGNDMQHAAHTLAAAKTNLQTVVNTYKSAGAAVLLRTYPYLSTAGAAAAAAGSPLASGATWDQFLSAVYDVADTADVALVDHSATLGDSNTLETAGLMYSDHLHLLTPGQAAIARADYRALVAA